MGRLNLIAVSILIIAIVGINANRQITYKVTDISNQDLKTTLDAANELQKQPKVVFNPPATVTISGFCNTITVMFMGKQSGASSTSAVCLGELVDLEKFIEKIIGKSTPASRNKIKTGGKIRVEANGEWIDLQEVTRIL